MEKLQQIEIKNFRGIKEAKLENFADINIFIGKNNTGKSTVLEAIYILGCKFIGDFIGEHSFVRILEKRGYSYERKIYNFIEEIKYRHLKNPILKSNVLEGEFEITVSDYGSEEGIKSIKEKRKEFNPENYVVVSIGRVDTNTWIADIYIWLNKELEWYMLYNEKLKEIFKKIFEKCLLIDDSLLRKLGASSKVFEILIDLYGWKVKKEILKGIRILYPEIVDIDTKEGILRIIFEDYAVLFPSLADGIKSTLLLSMTLYALEDGIICIEEPENHLHPALQELYIDYIVKSVKEKNNQIFVSTHSLEFLEKLLKKASEENVNINVYKFVKLEDGLLKYKLYKRDEALAGLEVIGYDLRQ